MTDFTFMQRMILDVFDSKYRLPFMDEWGKLELDEMYSVVYYLLYVYEDNEKDREVVFFRSAETITTKL